MALQVVIFATITAPNNSICSWEGTFDDITGEITQVRIINNTSLIAEFRCIWKTTTWVQGAVAGTIQAWVPPTKAVKWLTDPIQFQTGLS